MLVTKKRRVLIILTPASTTLSKERMNLNIPAKQPNDLLELIVGGSSETGKREV
ncbi:MAG: hypothetical protein ACJAZP_004161, partial [Psychromonas sp.]